MASIALMAASIAVSAIQTGAQNSELRRKQRAANETAAKQVEELQRQADRDIEVGQEKKSDRAREMDIALGTIMAAGADGGQTAAGIARLGGAAAAVAGLDIARVESNRIEAAEQKRASSTSIIEENLSMQEATSRSIRGNTLAFFGKAAGSLIGNVGGIGSVTSGVTSSIPTTDFGDMVFQNTLPSARP